MTTYKAELNFDPGLKSRTQNTIGPGRKRFEIIAPYNNDPDYMLINWDGLIVNAFHNIAGRNNYFSPTAGTSEGQLILIEALARVYQITGNPRHLEIFNELTKNLFNLLYTIHNAPPVDPAWNNFCPHWLFNVKRPFLADTYDLNLYRTFTHQGGGVYKATIAPHEFGQQVKKVFSVRDETATLIWDNPYSGINGTEYTIDHVDYNQPDGTRIYITGPAGASVNCYVVAAYFDTGDPIPVSTMHEAWPVWRRLDEGELDSAGDSVAWAYDAYEQALAVTGNAEYQDAMTATANTLRKICQVDDMRRWLRITWTATSAFALPGTYEYHDPLRAPSYFQQGSAIHVKTPATDPSGEVQYGRGLQYSGGIPDSRKATDTHIRAELGSADGTPITVQLWIQRTSSYSPSDRFTKTVIVTGLRELIEIPFDDFVNDVGNPLPVGDDIRTVGISVFQAGAFELLIYRCEPIPEEQPPYSPNVIPFTSNYLQGELITWRGHPGVGYQYPHVWAKLGETARLQGMLQFLRDAQNAYQDPVRGNIFGPFAPAYVWDRFDGQEYGQPNTWSWSWPDPNTHWGGYQYRPLASAAEAFYLTGNTTAGQIVGDFLSWLNSVWTSNTQGPPTDYPEDTPPSWQYHEPHMAALVLRAAMFYKLGGGDPAVADPLAQRALEYLDYLYVDDDPVMKGTFSSDPSRREWFGFWSAEILKTLTLLIQYNFAGSYWGPRVKNWIVEHCAFITRSMAIGFFDVADRAPLPVGLRVRVADETNPSVKWMEGIIVESGRGYIEIEVDNYVGSGTVTLWKIDFGVYHFGTQMVVEGGNVYQPRIVQPLLARREALRGKPHGFVRNTYGEIELANGDGELDGLAGYQINGYELVIKKGGAVVFNGRAEDIRLDGERAVILVNDDTEVLDKPFLPNRYAGNNALPDGLEGTADDLKGKPKPRVYGVVKNISPPLVNSARLIYQVSDTPVVGIDNVYDDGVSLTKGADYTSQADMESNPPAAGQFRAWPGGGYFRIGSNPAGVVTCDVTEGPSAERSAAQIWKRIAVDAGISNIDWAAMGYLDWAVPGDAGIWIDGESTTAELLTEMARSLSAWWWFDWTGMLKIQRLEEPTGSPVLTLRHGQIVSIQQQQGNLAGKGKVLREVRLNFQRNWTVQNDVAGSVTAARKAWLAEKHRSAVAIYAAPAQVSTTYELDTLLNDADDANNEAQRLLDLFKLNRSVFVVDAMLDDITAVDIGAIIQVQFPRYGLDSSKNLLVIGMSTNFIEGKATLTLWG